MVCERMNLLDGVKILSFNHYSRARLRRRRSPISRRRHLRRPIEVAFQRNWRSPIISSRRQRQSSGDRANKRSLAVDLSIPMASPR